MVDLNFFRKTGPYSLEELAEIGECELDLRGNQIGILIKNVASIDQAKEGDISFISNRKYLNFLNKINASACIVDVKFRDQLDTAVPLLYSKNPYKSYALIATKLYPGKQSESKISNLASIDQTAKIGKNCTIQAFASIGANVLIGNNSYIASGVSIEENVVIGDNCHIGANSVIQCSLIGNGVTIHPGVKIGQDGFGFASDASGHTRIPQLGRVVIGDDVNIGSNTCIDRGAINDTIVGKGTQIDNLVQIGHNVHIGKFCVIVSQVGISGSTKFGDFVVIGGQAGIAGHLEIGNGVQISAKAGVTKNIAPGQVVGGFPAVPLIEWKKMSIAIKKLIN